LLEIFDSCCSLWQDFNKATVVIVFIFFVKSLELE